MSRKSRNNVDDLMPIIVSLKAKYRSELLNAHGMGEGEALRRGAAIRFHNSHGNCLDFWPLTGTWMIITAPFGMTIRRGRAHSPHQCTQMVVAWDDLSNALPLQPLNMPEAQSRPAQRSPDPDPTRIPYLDDLASFEALRDELPPWDHFRGKLVVLDDFD